MGTVQPSFHYKYMQHLVLYTVCSYYNIHEFTWTSWSIHPEKVFCFFLITSVKLKGTCHETYHMMAKVNPVLLVKFGGYGSISLEI